MASFPTTLKNFISKLTGGVIEASHINDLQDEVSALETKVGVDNSSVTTSLDYLVKNTASVNPGHKHTLAGALTDVAVTSPTNGQALAYNTATSKWENTNAAVADASTTVKGVTKLSVAPVTASDPIAVGTNDARLADTSYANKGIVRLNTDANTSGLTVASGVVSVNTGTSANQIVKLDGTGKLPAVDGSQLTNVGRWNYISSVATSASMSVPATANFAIVFFGTSVFQMTATTILARSGATSQSFLENMGPNGVASITATWSGNTITLTTVNCTLGGGTTWFYT
jgi:hypothetical protein